MAKNLQKGIVMDIEAIQKEASWQNSLDSESEEFKVISKLFNGFAIGDTGVIKFTSNKEMAHYKKEKYDKDEIQSLMVRDNFIAIPFPDGLGCGAEDFMIFIPGQCDGARGEITNAVLSLSYIVEMVLKNDMFYEIEKK